MNRNAFKILIAEDDEIVRDVMVKFIEQEGYPTVIAHDGMEAIRLLRVEEIRLVLTDLRMPGADGMEVLRTASQINPGIPVVLLTAYGTLDTALEAMKEGAYDYIVKPFVMQQLLLVVRNAFRLVAMMDENEKLSKELKEMYSKIKQISSGNERAGEANSIHALDLIERLHEMDIIDSLEAKNLKERITGSGDKIKKYSNLINDLKGRESIG